MKNRRDLANKILVELGGAQNINIVNFCATRLRITPKEFNKINFLNLENIDGVLGIVRADNQVQIIIGTDVPNIYQEFIKLTGQTANKKIEENLDVNLTENKVTIRKIIDFISGTFVPVLPILVAAGLVSAVLNIATTFLGLNPESGTVVVLNAINTAGFYFLPIYIGYSAAKNLNINPFMGAYLGAILLTSTINGVENLNFLGINIPTVNYQNSVIPIILGVLFMYFVYRILDKIVIEQIKYFVNPLVAILIVTPITLIVLGPLGGIIGNYLAIALTWVNNKLGWLSVGLIGALTPLLVITGTNQALFPVVFAGLAEFGYEAFVMPGMLAANVAVGSAALATYFVIREQKSKALAHSSGITGVMGITEPALFGVLLKFKKPLLGAIIGGGVGGLFAGIVQLKQYAVVSPGIAALPTFIPPNKSGMSNFYFAVLTLIISITISFVSTYILLKRDKSFNSK